MMKGSPLFLMRSRSWGRRSGSSRASSTILWLVVGDDAMYRAFKDGHVWLGERVTTLETWVKKLETHLLQKEEGAATQGEEDHGGDEQ